ncbi:glucose 1-dehydrogenase [Pusillimonas sp.]|uniref:SDR family NAD(P)-dependent oxidoreductase n=1 Tax=Pusillimonas sp. TaxID=3040095 RepID=UPI0029ACF3E5|nr:glucose 1-dehydrogenase [Pusillimonas sp.]MDX3896126.1 glucose 1-dehydrogenase [Pusillimonas sp.]
MQLSNKVAVVTGGAMGIGYAICEHLAGEGARIVVADRANAGQAAEKLKSRGFDAIGVDADVSSESDTENIAAAALDAYGALDVLVNNAAIFSTIQQKPFDQLSVQDWRSILDVNVIGQFLCCRAVLPAFRKQGGGRIINISSGVAFKGNPNMLHYVATKGAVVSMTRAMATELGEDNVLINSVAPGFTLSEGVLKNPELAERSSQFSIKGRALRRDMLPNDVVGAVAFFAGPGSSFITGQTLVVDGGAYFH